MGKYIQTVIPVANDEFFKDMPLGKLKQYVRHYFNENLRNSSVVNFEKKITIKFSRTGFDHLIHARNIGYIKLKAVVILDKMIKYAEFIDFKDKDIDDSIGILGYFNFQCKATVEEKIHLFRIVIRMTKDGEFYYDHAVRVDKK